MSKGKSSEIGYKKMQIKLCRTNEIFEPRRRRMEVIDNN